MPLISRTNNRVLGPNARATDPARATMDRILDIQTRRYQEAFRVEGRRAIIYYPLTRGEPCGCKHKETLLHSQLDEEGNAHKGLINELLVGEPFRVTHYGGLPANVQKKAAATDEDPDGWEAVLPDGEWAAANTDPNAYDNLRGPTPEHAGKRSSLNGTNKTIGNTDDGLSSNPDDPTAMTLMPLDLDSDQPMGFEQGAQDANGWSSDWDFLHNTVVDFDDAEEVSDRQMQAVLAAEAEKNMLERGGLDLLGLTDSFCPVCMGTGWVGGYSLHNGWRLVVGAMSADVNWESNGLEPNQNVPTQEGVTEFTLDLVLPKHGVCVDALRLWNNRKVIPCSFTIDGQALTTESDLLKWCDGVRHTLIVRPTTASNVTHLEIQVNQSESWALLEFPRQSRTGNVGIPDDWSPTNINVSPFVPHMEPRCVVFEGSYNKFFMVGQVSSWNDRRRRVLGWDCEVRVLQPSEMQTLLPRRYPLESTTRPAQVVDNGSGRRT